MLLLSNYVIATPSSHLGLLLVKCQVKVTNIKLNNYIYFTLNHRTKKFEANDENY
jgi:hypothetical protein